MESLNKLFNFLLWGSLFVLGVLYMSCSMYDTLDLLPNISFLIVSILLSVLYLVIYRRNSIFCYETFFLLLFVLSTYFNEIIVKNMLDTSNVMLAYFNVSFSNKTENKGIILNTLCLVVFLIGATRVNMMSSNTIHNNFFKINRNLSLSINVLAVITGLYIMYLGLSGVISSWFQYSNNVSDFSNSDIVYLTMLFLVNTSLEFSRLFDNKCNSLKSFFLKVNRIYFVEILFIGGVLLISGNRNECLLVMLPMIVSYHIFIKKIDTKQFFIMFSVGVSLMIVIGLTRQSNDLALLQDKTINLYEMSRDFCFVDNNTKYLIDFTDKFSPAGFKNAFLNLLSSIPFLGGIVVSVTGLSYDTRSVDLTTQGMQLSSNMESGLGTSLMGDLYYTGGTFFTLFFMYFLGWLIATLYRRFMIEKKYDIWMLIIYLFMFSNVVYIIRAEWTMPFRYIGFSFVIALLLRLIQPIKKLK